MTTFEFGGLLDRFEHACQAVCAEGPDLSTETYERYRDARDAVISAFDDVKHPQHAGTR